MQIVFASMMVVVYSVCQAQNREIPPVRVGGCGGLYLLAEPGELWVDIEKKDRHDGRRDTRLQAILLGPDRLPRDQAIIERDGSVRLTTQVDQKAVFVVNVTVTQDRYGDQIGWGFDTNCAKYLVETSRGHRDARHVEPIVLRSPNTSGNVCFLPPPGTFQIEISNLEGADPLEVYDGTGTLRATLSVGENGEAKASLESGDSPSDSPWRLHLPAQQATIQIDGVTRWESGDRFANLSLWSPQAGSFFPFREHRWMLTPYSRTFYAAAGESREFTFRLHNNSEQPDTLSLRVETLGEWNVDAPTTVELESGKAKKITVQCNMPDDAPQDGRYEARLVVNSSLHPEMTTYSTLIGQIGDPPYRQPLKMPLVYRPYEHENEQFGYEPDYPTENQIYFAPDNQPYLSQANGTVHALRDGQWVPNQLRNVKFAQAPATKFGGMRPIGTKVAFDSSNNLYLLASHGKDIAYLHSRDGGETFTAQQIKGREGQRRGWEIEQFSGHNIPNEPPPFLRNTQTQGSDARNFWRRVNDLELFVPRRDGDQIVIGDPILLSDKAIGISSHSGLPSAIASRGDRIHIVWGEATDPDQKAPGVPAYVVTYERQTGLLGEPVFVGWGPPANDVHNTPSITIDSEGYLHTLTGTHGQPFAYARSLEPNTAHAGFTTPEIIEKGLRSTYIGLVCDQDDTLHLVFRVWASDGVYHPTSHYANLGYKRKPKGGPWEEMRRLAVAPFSEYSIFYHRLTIDHKGRLFVSFDYWSTYWFYRMDHVGSQRKTIFSSDGGETWKLLETQDL